MWKIDYATKSIPMENLHVNINLSIQQLMDVVKQLSPDEKLILNEAIWSEGMDIPQEHQINSLKSNPSGYSIRYAEVRCMIIKKFPHSWFISPLMKVKSW